MKSFVLLVSTRWIKLGRSNRRLAFYSGGFTLVELLVVLVIIGLISGVLLTGFERVLDIRLRLGEFLDGVEAPVLVADWFRASIGGLVPDAPDGPDKFIGAPRKMIGLSLAPINATAGVPTRITWQIVFNDQTRRSELRYSNEEQPDMIIASWPGNIGALWYCGSDFVCHDTWPPDKEAAQLPSLVRLDAIKGDDRWPILAAPQADRNPLQTRSNGL
jgi:prepilin-type N-terminal cleavage/methylation domain-containing protein